MAQLQERRAKLREWSAAALDATQSGIQHFAAASLNPADGEKVNCTASTQSDKPYDFYAACLAAARKLIIQDLQDNKIKLAYEPWTEEDKAALQEYQEFQAQPWPEDFEEAMALSEQKNESHKAFKETRAYSMRQLEKDIQAAGCVGPGDEYDRSVIKRNAMTYAYSSRQFGFADQLRSDWMNDFTKEVRQKKREKHPFGKDRGYHAAFYLAGIHEKAIEQTVQSAAAGMKFLQDVGVILAVDASEDDIEADKKRNFNGRHFRLKMSWASVLPILPEGQHQKAEGSLG